MISHYLAKFGNVSPNSEQMHNPGRRKRKSGHGTLFGGGRSDAAEIVLRGGRQPYSPTKIRAVALSTSFTAPSADAAEAENRTWLSMPALRMSAAKADAFTA